jgi:LysR family transcriptional regulator, transcriptional activator of nhaA
MRWINYHHLLYFWVVAREGSIARACEELHVSQPTISGQLAALGKALKVRLFRRAGRGLALTDDGRLVYRYAEQIFSIGRELGEALEGRPTGRPLKFTVGVLDALPKLAIYTLLEPALKIAEPIELICYEGKLDALLADLALHKLDLVLADSPAGTQPGIRAFSHPLGDCGVSIFAEHRLAEKHRRRFPGSLSGAPMLLPTGNTNLRRGLDQWFSAHKIQANVVGEFEDSGLMKAFGQAAVGLFPGPSVIESEICRQYHARVVGRIDEVRESYYAISVERRLRHPAVVAIFDSARENLFASKSKRGRSPE